MSEHALDHNDHAEHEHHIVPIKTYFGVLLALLVLMVITLAAAQMDLTPIGNNFVAMAVAFTKATLVVTFFMGFKYSTKLVKIWILLGFIWLPLMSFIYADYTTRQYEESQIWNEKDRDSSLPRERIEPIGDGKKPMEEQTDVNIRPRF